LKIHDNFSQKIPLTDIELEIYMPWRKKQERSSTVSKAISDIKSKYKPTATSPPPSSSTSSTIGSSATNALSSIRSKFGGNQTAKKGKEDMSVELLEK
jgi:hypothetical protein